MEGIIKHRALTYYQVQSNGILRCGKNKQAGCTHSLLNADQKPGQNVEGNKQVGYTHTLSGMQ